MTKFDCDIVLCAGYASTPWWANTVRSWRKFSKFRMARPRKYVVVTGGRQGRGFIDQRNAYINKAIHSEPRKGGKIIALKNASKRNYANGISIRDSPQFPRTRGTCPFIINQLGALLQGHPAHRSLLG